MHSKKSSELEDEDWSTLFRRELFENEYSSTDHDSLTAHGDIDISSTSIPTKSTHLLSRGKTTEEFLNTISIFEVAEDELSSLPFSSKLRRY
jgi:outer membrane lipopolysaccharide assembly protein LptE/RlpB